MTPLALVVVPFAAQGIAMAIDERRFHRRRGLPRWERIGHVLDTTTVLASYAFALTVRPTAGRAVAYAALVLASSLFVTKDEPVHAARCTAGEHWIHALLFVLHPMVLGGVGLAWWAGRLRGLVVAQAALTAAFGTYQLVYWNLRWRRAR
jgi:hypothetical protein